MPRNILSERLAASNLRERALQAASNAGDLDAVRWRKAVESFVADLDDILAVKVDPADVTRAHDGQPCAVIGGLTIRRYGLEGLQVSVDCEKCGNIADRVFSTLGNLGAHLKEPGLCPDCDRAEFKKRRGIW